MIEDRRGVLRNDPSTTRGVYRALKRGEIVETPRPDRRSPSRLLPR
jgi:hypothetical protein